MREAIVKRTTKETDVYVKLGLDGTGVADVDSGCGFFDHMLTALSKHGHFDLTVKCKGDTEVDFHHSAEDIGICLGQAFLQAVGDAKGITRYGFSVIPMDDALVLSSVDISGRAYLNFDVAMPAQKVGDFDTELVKEFFYAFARNAKITLHFKGLAGDNAHHVAECVFKSFARTLSTAVSINEKFKDETVSTKGIL
jgi:imidazoleglycerol-phosphate dehydratase